MFLTILKLKAQVRITCVMFFLFLINNLNAQVGIGTTTPNAVLDVVAGANNYGFLMPRVSLTATNAAAPVKNPATGAFLTNTVAEIGTIVFNTNTTAGTYGVLPGIYYWDGTKWVSQIHRYFQTKFTQNADLSVNSSGSYTNIPGITNVSFVAPYDGEYHFIFSGYLGASSVNTSSAKVGFVEGNFKCTIIGVDYRKYSHSTSFYNSATLTNYYELFNETNINIDVYLTAGQVCTINSSYNGIASDNISGTPHVIGRTTLLGNLCEVNVAYLGR